MSDLVGRLEQNRDEFLAVAGQLSEDMANVALADDGWTLWGVMAHLTAAEWQLRRLAEIIAENPAFEFDRFDRDELNARSVMRYEGLPISKLVEQWKSNRQKTIEFIGRLSAEQLETSVVHPNYGQISPQYPIERSLWHTIEHLAEIKAAVR